MKVHELKNLCPALLSVPKNKKLFKGSPELAAQELL
jgi:hypothetical protein